MKTCGLTVQVRNRGMLAVGDFWLLRCNRDFTGSYIRSLSATNVLGSHIQKANGNKHFSL